MKISVIVEGKTEKAFLPHLKKFLQSRLQDKMPKIDIFPCNGRIPKEKVLRRIVRKLLSGHNPADYVIALTDVYTGSQSPGFH